MSEFVMDGVSSSGTNEDMEQPSARIGETTHQIGWCEFSDESDTFEPICHDPRCKIVRYYKRIKQPLLKNTNEV